MSNPIVTFEMENGGVIKAELYPDVAPQSVNNFISLAYIASVDKQITNVQRSYLNPC